MSLSKAFPPALAVVALALAVTAIWLTFDNRDPDDTSRGETSDETFTMPELRGQPMSSARQGLTDAGFMGSIAVVPEALDEPSAVVIEQQPRAGSTMASDGLVTLSLIEAAEVFPNFLLIRNDTSDPIWIVEPGKRGRIDPHEQLRYATEWACARQPLKALTPNGDVLSRYTGACDGSTWRITSDAD